MRKVRVLQEGAIYHVVAKSNRGEFILNSDEIKTMFIEILKEAKKKYSFKLKHFCIMSNHIHLLIEPTNGTSLSRMMQWILSVFAIRFNKIFGQIGHVWYDRFKSKIIQNFKQFLRTFAYISDNPVKAGLCITATGYRFSGIRFIREKLFDFIDPPEFFLYFTIQELHGTQPALPII